MRPLVREAPFLPPVDPIQPSRQPSPPPADSVRGDKRGGGGPGYQKREKEQPEPEEPEEGEGAEPDAHLDADSFARRRGTNNLDALFADKLPWEQEEDEAKARVEELRQQRMKSNTRPLGGTKPLGTRAPLPGARPPLPPPPPIPRGPVGPQGRQVDGTFDHTAAVNSTLSAWQTLRDRQAAEQRQAEEREELRQPSQRPTSGPILGRANRAQPPVVEPGPALQPPNPLDERIQPEPAAGAPRKPMAPPPKVRLPGEAAPMPELFPQEEAPEPTRGTAQLKPPLPARKDTPPRGPLPPREATAPLKPPVDAKGKPIPEPSWARPEAPQPSWTAAEAAPPEAPKKKEPPPKPIVPAKEAPAPSWVQPEAAPVLDFNDLMEAPPPPQELSKVVPEAPKPAPPSNQPKVKVNGTRAAFTYQVMDAATSKPMRGARLELEPTMDDLLPVLNGQADLDGWWAESMVAPGEYRVTVRCPGYVPSFQLRQLKAGEVDESSIFMSKP